MVATASPALAAAPVVSSFSPASEMIGDSVTVTGSGFTDPAQQSKCLYVVSGTVQLQIGDQLIQAPAGSYVIKPRGLPHAFWNPASTPALALEITTPGGFEAYYDDMAKITSPAEALAVQAKYGITFQGDLAAQLISRHRLPVGDIPQEWHQREAPVHRAVWQP